MNTNLYCSDLNLLEVLALTTVKMTLVCSPSNAEAKCEVFNE